MKIGLRKSPHLEAICAGILACGDTFTSTNDTGADFYLCWGWPQGQDVVKQNGGRSADVICVDAHPFALRAGDRSGDRILQLGNWGRLAMYPPVPIEQPGVLPRWPGDRSVQGGPVLTMVRGRVVMEAGKLVAEPGWGKPAKQQMPPPAPRHTDKTTAAITAREGLRKAG